LLSLPFSDYAAMLSPIAASRRHFRLRELTPARADTIFRFIAAIRHAEPIAAAAFATPPPPTAGFAAIAATFRRAPPAADISRRAD